MTNSAVSIPGRRRQAQLTTEQELEIIRLYLDRVSLYQICKIMGRGYDAVRRVVNDHPEAKVQMAKILEQDPNLKRPYLRVPDEPTDADAYDPEPVFHDALLVALQQVHGHEKRFGGPEPTPPNATIDVRIATSRLPR